MHKLCVNTGLSRGRPFPVPLASLERSVSPVRSFHPSPAKSEGEAKPKIFGGTLRNQKYTQQLQDLYQKSHTRREDRTTNPGFRLLKLGQGQNHAPSGTIDLTNLASQPSGKVHIVRRPLRTQEETTYRDRGVNAGGSRGGGSRIERSVDNEIKIYRSSAPTRDRGGRDRARGGPGRGDGEDRSTRNWEGGGRGEDDFDTTEGGVKFTVAEYEHLASIVPALEEMEDPSDQAYVVPEFNANSLAGNGPAVAMGEWGAKEVVEERLDAVTKDGMIDNAIRIQELAQKILQGEWVRFRDDEEQRATQILAQDIAQRRATLRSEQKGEVVEATDTTWEVLSTKQREAMTKALLSGNYKLEEDLGTLPDLVRQLRRNGSISPRQEGAIRRKVLSIAGATKNPRPLRPQTVAPARASESAPL
ncbi:hypothetical protein MMC19_007585 [Ptychographa xylographoides]|nr:hypothetical protein [Ptychographa xylographoides]